MQTLEKIPRGIELVARGISGHGSVPLEVERGRAPVRRRRQGRRVAARHPLNETTAAYFKRLARDLAARGGEALPRRAVDRSEGGGAADDWLFENEPRHASMLRTSVSPNIIQGGYRSTSSRRRPRRRSTCACCPTRTPARSSSR